MDTTTDTTVATAVIGMVFIFILTTYVIVSVFLGLIFKKAGIPAWKAFVPVYNSWVTLQLGGQKGWLALLTLVPIANIVASVYLYIAMYYIGLRLGKDGSFVLWAIFFPVIWYIWLGSDGSTWSNPTGVANNTDNGTLRV